MGRIPLALVAGAALLTASCSVLVMKRISADHQSDEFPDCTSSVTMPLADGMLTVLAGATAVNLHAAASNPENDGKNFRAFAWSATAVAMVFLGSATYGALVRNRCRHAQDLYGPNVEADVPNRPPPGLLGGRCRRDDSCEGDLICDVPMKTCIQLEKSDETLSPTEP